MKKGILILPAVINGNRGIPLFYDTWLKGLSEKRKGALTLLFRILTGTTSINTVGVFARNYA